ncbi:GPI mannosyltransferase 1 [Tieghemiomyces parasiticus]|uniref:GPI mannosyltransferase 1 n=1 Tax=Tieghemiomyces parasiticus TaxID=78921 RepID=A0A9W8ABW1_9FUNG|nr:GPI mannosyltransferase 1 [Tieghemiomyces parasiticus]
MLSLKSIFAIAAALRLALLAYGLWQDRHFLVKYTDVDYKVFTDAAQFVYEGRSPYDRSTYRYTPLLAWLLVPNVTLHPAWGKLLFVAADLAVGYLMVRTIRRLNGNGGDETSTVDKSLTKMAEAAPPSADDAATPTTATAALAPPPILLGPLPRDLLPVLLIWLWNPMVANISTRGNAESLMGLLVLGTLYLLGLGHHRAAAIVYGLAVHFKIYPILYALPIILALRRYPVRRSPTNAPGASRHGDDEMLGPWWHINRYQVEFALISAGTFLGLNGVMYAAYGHEFVHETYLYHLIRKDHRHNFSVWFYPIYLTYASPTGLLAALLAFIPQIGLCVVLGALFADDLFFSCFVQTFAFVAYNKVVTSQYFMWYFALLPLVLPFTDLPLKWRGLTMLGAWVAGQVLWLQFAFQLEFRARNTFLELWVAGALFFVANNWILLQFVRFHRPVPTLDRFVTTGRVKVA